MSDPSQSLSHSRWNGKYHVVFVPKRRRQALFGNIRKALGPIFHALARQKECHIIYRVDGIQGAVLSVKLRHLDSWNAARCQIAGCYQALLDDTPLTLQRQEVDR